MIPIARPILGEEELAAVKEVLASGMLAQGPKVKAFEAAFARDLGRKHGIAVANGTAALHIALLAHAIGNGAEVIVPPLTFFATASTVLLCGAKPAFVDVDGSLYNLDPAKIATSINRKTSTIMPVHLYGQTTDMEPIVDSAKENGIPVIEDAAQAHGAEYHGKKAGNLGDTACFSFYATKNMTTGEGGEIVRLLTEDGIGSRPSYPMPLYQQKALRDLRIRGRCPVAEDVVPRLFELPVHPGVGPAEIERILSAVERIARPA